MSEINEFIVIVPVAESDPPRSDTYHILTTGVFVNSNEEMAYRESKANFGRPVHMGDQILMAVLPGPMKYHFLQHVADKGKDFRLVSMDNDDLGKKVDDKPANFLKNKVDKTTVAWAREGVTRFMSVVGEKDWGFGALGLKAISSKKLAKRAQEVTRSSKYAWESKDSLNVLFTEWNELVNVTPTVVKAMEADVVFACFRTPEHLIAMHGKDDAIKLFDGLNVVSKRLAKRMRFGGTHGSIRSLNPHFTLKGNFIVVDDDLMGGADVLYHEENAKPELSTTDGYTLITFDIHHHIHQPSHVQGPALNNPHMVTTAKRELDLGIMAHEALEAINGNIPTWMKLPLEDLHEEKLVNQIDVVQSYTKSYFQWQAAGQDLRASKTYMQMLAGGISNRMDKGWVAKAKTHKKMWIPMTNALSAAVTTYSFMTEMAGMVFPDHDGTKSFFVGGVGWVYPDQRFIDTFDLKGGQDQDDTNIFVDTGFWSSDEFATANLLADGVLDPALEIPSTPEEAVPGAYSVRLPDGPGEYSIEAYEGDVPFYQMHEDRVIVDLAKLPRGQGHLISLIEMKGLCEDHNTYGHEFNKADALYMIEAMLENEGIGALTQAMYCWVNVMGVSFPPKMLDVFGNMVDAVQQGWNKDQIKEVAAAAGMVYKQLVQAMHDDPTLKIDRQLAFTRMPESIRDEIRKEQIVTGKWTKLSVVYGAMSQRIKDKVNTLALEARAESELAIWARSLKVKPADILKMQEFNNTYQIALRDIRDRYDNKSVHNKYRKVMNNNLKHLETEALVQQMIRHLERIGGEKMAMVLYCHLVSEQPRNRREEYRKFGLPDTVLFQTTHDGASLANMLLDFLRKVGKAV